MHIKRIKLMNFRNYDTLELEFCKGYNVISGKNAQGKTNILEAIFLCSTGRSHRTSKDNELVKFLKENYYINIEIGKKYGDTSIVIYYKKNEKKKIKINEVPIKRSGELMGRLNTVLFSPEDLSIIKDGPLERRRFIDIALSQLKPVYFYDLQQYARILSQRNHLLKNIIKSGSNIKKERAMLEIWNEKLIETGSKIVLERGKYLAELNKKAKENHNKLTRNSEQVEIKYNPSVVVDSLENVDSIKNEFERKIHNNIDKELKNGMTLYGPQRDDFEIKVNEKNVRIYGSQGQQRTTVLTLKLSEMMILKECTGEDPVLLLDDVFSELDNKRQECIINNLDKVQVFITTTDKLIHNNINMEEKLLFHVSDGKIKSIKSNT